MTGCSPTRLGALPGGGPGARSVVVRHGAQACAGRDLVISAVTAGQALAVARAAAPHLKGAIFLDLNSVAPHTRVASQAAVDRPGRALCRGAVMAPIAPKRLKTPILLGGPHAAAFAPWLERLGLAAEVLSDEVGRPRPSS
jgi:3-hydroxyisobutyrate dehydrogenase-like beta-hydroxyacid dehydrogenase